MDNPASILFDTSGVSLAVQDAAPAGSVSALLLAGRDGSDNARVLVTDAAGILQTAVTGTVSVLQQYVAALNSANTGFAAQVGGVDSTIGKLHSLRTDNHGSYGDLLIHQYSDARSLLFEFTNANFDTGAGSSMVSITGIALPGAGGPVVGGTAANPIIIQPSAAVAVTNAGLTNLDVALSTVAKDATLTTRLPAALDADGGLKAHIQNSVAVTGPLTDTQLRATPVPVSGTVAVTGPLTDTQLRAAPVPISGTVTAAASGDYTVVGKGAAGAAVSGNPVLMAGSDGTNVRTLGVETNGSLKVTGRPNDVLGSYRVTTTSGLVAAGFGGPKDCWSFRTGASNYSIVRKVTVAMWDVTTGFAVGLGRFDLFVGRSFSGSFTSNGTAATISGNNGKKKTAQATTSIAQIYTLATSTSGIVGSTHTKDTQPLASVAFQVIATVNQVLLPTVELVNFSYDNAVWPLVLAPNEGLVLQATVPATGTWTFTVSIEWEEMSATL